MVNTLRMAATTTNGSRALRLDFVRWQVRSLLSARQVCPWSLTEQAAFEALTVEERLLLDTL
jgi:hypothetical protein